MEFKKPNANRNLPKKSLGRPVHNPNYVLTSDQKAFITAILITDGWITVQKGGKNPSVGFQNSKQNEAFVQYFCQTLDSIITAEVLPRFRGAPRSRGKLFEQLQIRTVAHPQLWQFVEAFNGSGKNKTIPKVSYLMEILDWNSIAVIFMCDGSRKGKGRGMEIHLQGFKGVAPASRLCIALYEKFGMKAFPSYYGKSSSGENQYHIQISGYSLPVIRDKVLPLMLDDFKYKIPETGKIQRVDAYNSPWRLWYRSNKNAIWRETFSEE
jgi:hypothetical protein